MKVIIANDNDKPAWNHYCDQQINVPPLQYYEWQKILTQSYRVNFFPLMSLDQQNKVTGLLPVYLIKDYSGINKMYSLKFGLIADDYQTAKALTKHAMELGKEYGAVSLTITSGMKHFELVEDHIIACSVSLSLGKTEEEMWGMIRSKARNMVKKAQKENIIVERGKQNLDEFYQAYSRRMLEKGVRIHSKKYFENIIHILEGQTQLFVARKYQEIIGGMFLVYGPESAAYIYGGSIVDQGTSPNQLLLWEMARFCISKGVRHLDLGESIEGSGVYNFKVWFGGTPGDIHYENFLLESQKKPLLLQPVNRAWGQLMRGGSYLLLHHGTPGLKKIAAIWKRSKGPIQ